MDGAFRIFGAVAEGDNGGDGFFARNLEEGAEAVGITLTNMSILKSGKAKAIKVTTIELDDERYKAAVKNVSEKGLSE